MTKSRAYSIILDAEVPITNDAERQLKKFQDLARELECDEDEDAFGEKLKQMARAPKREAREE